MPGKKNRKTHSIDRRSFVGTTVKLVTLGTILMPLAEACNNKKSSKPTIPGTDTTKGKTAHSSAKKHRKKWSHESLIMNEKSHVIHFPNAALYTYYDQIKSGHILIMDNITWPAELENTARLNKQQSGNIVEAMVIKGLKHSLGDDLVLEAASDTLSIAFRPEYEKANSKNFRLHELMLQLIALNNRIPAEQKWTTFNLKVKRPEQLRKRQQWMANESNFNQRVNYIVQRRDEYLDRFKKREARYSFT